MITLKYCTIRPVKYGCDTIFFDDTISSNWPPGDETFARVVKECGFDDLIKYIVDHDLSHAYLAEKMFDAPSPVLWDAAHGGCAGQASTLYEERMVYHWQRFANNLIPPIEPEWANWYDDYKHLQLEITR